MRPSSDILRGILAHRPRGRIVVLGDCILDCYISGEAERLSREAPIPVLRHRKQQFRPGGAANVACNVAAMDFPVTLLGVTGDDSDADEFIKTFVHYPALLPAIVRDPARRTTLKTRFISQSQQMFRFDRQDASAITVECQAALLKNLEKEVDSLSALIISDYGNGVLSSSLLRHAIDLARARNVPIVVDPRRQDVSDYRGATFITPNLEELARASGSTIQKDMNDDRVVVEAAQVVQTRAEVEGVLATRGAKGLTLLFNQSVIHLPAQAQQVFDVTGAGDCVVSWFTIGLCSGLKPLEAAIVANLAGGLAVGEVGAAVLDRMAMRRLAEAPGHGHGYKIHTPDSLIKHVSQWRQRDLRVGFTNGCFDILHAGHVVQLNFAQEQCDRLIVALNSDDSVRKIKGSERPIQIQQRRAEVIAALVDVDAVVIFDAPDPVDLIEAIKPNVYIKGSDYDLDSLKEAKAVRRYGGMCLSAPLLPGASTSLIIEAMRATTPPSKPWS